MPITNNTNLIGKKILEILDNATKDWPANPGNVAEGYRALLGSQDPAGLYMGALKEVGGKTMKGYGDWLAEPMNLALMSMKTPDVKAIIMANKAAGRPLLQGITQDALDAAEAGARQGKHVEPSGSFGEWADAVTKGKFETPETPQGGPKSLMERDYGSLNDKERNLVNNLLDPNYIKALLPFLFAGGAARNE